MAMNPKPSRLVNQQHHEPRLVLQPGCVEHRADPGDELDDRSCDATLSWGRGLDAAAAAQPGMRRSGLGYTVCPAARNDQVNDSHDRHEQT
jgi:hypothetical protein